MTSVNQEDEFTEVARKRKKRKAISSPTLPALQKPSSSEPPSVTPARPRSSYRNTITVIISGIDQKFQNWRQIMGGLIWSFIVRTIPLVHLNFTHLHDNKEISFA